MPKGRIRSLFETIDDFAGEYRGLDDEDDLQRAESNGRVMTGSEPAPKAPNTNRRTGNGRYYGPHARDAGIDRDPETGEFRPEPDDDIGWPW